MLIDLLPTPPAWLVIPGVILWDLMAVWAIWRLSSRPAKRHRFVAPKVAESGRKRKLWRDPSEKIVRVDRDADLW